MFTPDQKAALEAPLAKSNVKTREQGGKTLSYIEGWVAIAEANRIFGFDAWQRETVQLTETNRDLVELIGKNGPYTQWRVGYLARVKITVGAIVREGVGFGSGMAKPEALGDAIESAIKEAETDAMKRAMMTFGNPFGLALYDKTQANVADAPKAPPQKSAFLIAAEVSIEMCSDQARLDQWKIDNKAAMDAASDEEYATIAALWKARSAAVRPKAVA